MSGSNRAVKIAVISLVAFFGLASVALASYYVYENRTELPIIKNFFAEETAISDLESADQEDATIAPAWTIKIVNGNVVKTYPDGSSTVLADKDDYDHILKYTYVATSPDYRYMCFLGQTIAPMMMYVARTDGSEMVEDGIAENCVWSNDSSMIAYTNHTTDVSPHDVHVYSLSTDESTNFTRDLSTEHVMRVYEEPVWSNDDTTITSLYNSYDDQDDWAQSTGYTIITLATGDVRDVASYVDTSDWLTYSHDDTGVTLRYPADWSASEVCDGSPGELCDIEVTDDEYIWTLDYDPFVTGGGFGFLFDTMHLKTDIRTALSVDGYTPTIVSNYYDGAALAAEMGNATIPTEGEPWGWSITFMDPNDHATLGFGPGAMYDDTENNFWSIKYQYDLVYPSGGSVDFSNLPVKDDPELIDALLIMNAISESVTLPE